MKFITRNFLKGILFAGPISVTLYIIYGIFMWVDGLGNRLLGLSLSQNRLMVGAGFLIAIALITLIGYFSSLWVSTAFFRWVSSLFTKTPLLKGIYGTVRDTLHSFLGENKFFSQVVLVSFPNNSFKRIGFVTRENFPLSGEKEEQIVVYLPHSFQISGEMIIVPKTQVKFLDIPPETALKMILSAGIAKD